MARSEGEPTEEPTPQRLLKARARGEVGVSRDLSAALGFTALAAVLAGTAPAGVARMVAIFRQVLAAAPGIARAEPFLSRPIPAIEEMLRTLALILAVPLTAAMAMGVLVGALQTGGLFSWQALRPDLSRLSPIAGLKRVFGVRVLVEAGKGLVKVALVLAAAVSGVGWGARGLPALAGAGPAAVLASLGLLLQRLGVRVALVLTLWGLVDWLFARRRHRRSLMMTRDEVKREYKEAEGDPRHRSERQRLHRQLSEQRMINDVRKADFVVVNPDHIAVAIKYDRDADGAPQVVARGERLLAEQIKQVARQAGVPIYRDVGLARALNQLPEGEEIPEALYEAVAELLRVLWEIDRPGTRAGGPPTGGPAKAEAVAGSQAPTAAEAADGSTDASAGQRPGGAARAPSSAAVGRSAASTWKRV